MLTKKDHAGKKLIVISYACELGWDVFVYVLVVVSIDSGISTLDKLQVHVQRIDHFMW